MTLLLHVTAAPCHYIFKFTSCANFVGVTVHEAGDDNKLETLDGFAWPLRLRALMESVTTIDEAKSFWESTNNTLGINHGIGSAVDKKFLALETRAGYTAYVVGSVPRGPTGAVTMWVVCVVTHSSDNFCSCW